MELPQSVKQENDPEALKALLSCVLQESKKMEVKIDRFETEKAKKTTNIEHGRRSFTDAQTDVWRAF
jgi:hypothetical protein